MRYQEPIDAFYTHSEKTDRKYTVGFAVKCADRRLKAKGFKGGICMNAVWQPFRRDYNESITLQEVNRIADRIVDDSYYHDTGI